jgi:glyoxylase-like metal-dependent hydrolase (beta-lactamase superfamily II)
LNVGQANCLVLLDPCPEGRRSDLQAVVIDVGVDGTELSRWLRSVGVRYIPLIALTHNDKDHILGLEGLVQGFRRHVGQVRFVIDRDPEDIPFYLPAQQWQVERTIGNVDEIRVPTDADRSSGLILMGPPQCSYHLVCLYPTVFQNRAAVAGAKTVGPKPRKNPNTTSAVMGLSLSSKPRKWRVLFGADLHLSGWRSLVDERKLLSSDVLIAPHHGGPQELTRGFGYAEHAREISPIHTIVSVGTEQTDYCHPVGDFIEALLDEGSTVACTQLNRQCVKDPYSLPDRTVLALRLLTDPTDLAPSGVSCAGTVAVVVRDDGPPTVLRIGEHQAAVEALRAAGHKLLCRP